jgi:hypothetical protein
MAAVKSVPIKDSEDKIVGQYFEASNSFLNSLRGDSNRSGNYVAMTRPDGQVIGANRKLATRGYYDDKGYEKAKETKK